MALELRHESVFRHLNEWLAQVFCSIILAFLGTIFLFRKLEQYRWHAKSHCPSELENPARPQSRTSELWAKLATIVQRSAYFRLHINGIFSWLSPPSTGRILLLLLYWALIIFMLTCKAIIHDAEYYERIGFRAAWTSLAQVPLIYLRSSKAGLVAYLAGSSYERLNWLHRWVSRTLLVTLTIHGGFFMREWIKADFFWTELRLMPMVKFGIYARFLLVWIFLSSMNPVRRAFYEFFVLQHIISAIAFLWLIWLHVTSHAGYFVWISIAALSFDWVARTLLLVYQNIHNSGIGYQALLTANDNEITILTLENVSLSWKPGQHIRLWILD